MQKVTTVLIDDIDGSDAAETIAFAIDGTSYEIDLNETHAQDLRQSLASYVANARRCSGGRRARGGRKPANSPASSSTTKDASKTSKTANAAEIRDWARANGYDVPDRGRIPSDVREAFESAN